MDLRRRLRGPAATRGIIAVGAVLLAHGLAAGSLVFLQTSNSEVVLPGTVVAGVAVGGLERAPLHAEVDRRAEELLNEEVRVSVTPGTETDAAPSARDGSSAVVGAAQLARADELTESDELTVITDRRAIGMTVDAAAAADDAWSLGRRGLWRALLDQLRARTGTPREVALPRDLDPDRTERWATSTAAVLSHEAQPAEVELIAVSSPDDTRIEVTPARSGARVPAEQLRSEAEAGYAVPGPLEIHTSRQVVAAPTTDTDLDAAVDAAELARSGAVTLRNPSPGADVELSPTDLAAILTVGFAPDAPEGERLPLTADPEALLDQLGDALEAISIDAEEARIELQDGTLEVVGGSLGFVMDLQSTADLARTTSQRTSAREAPLPGTVLTPDATRGELRWALMASGLDVTAGIVLENDTEGDDLELSPDQLTELLEVTFDPDAPVDEALTVAADGDRLLELLDEDVLAAIVAAPIEPRFQVADGEVSITEGVPGTSLDAELAARRLAELATDPAPRAGTLPLRPENPELTLEEAQELGIEEEVSSFTTSMVAGQARNRNIRQAADYLDGSLVLPGERLSLNQAIGRRTTARGFGEGGFIRDGEIVEVVGGGVSQMATTFMNAAWFAGVELVEFQPHSLYFAQYPVGRESTMSGNTLDVVFENDSPYGILVTTDHSDTHVTVSFWSTEWAEVDTWTGQPTNRVPGQLRDGFDVNFGRTITYPDGTSTDESYFHRYRPENAP